MPPQNSFFLGLGTLFYNGYYFDSTSNITVDSINVRDEADRTTIYIRHDITVKATVAPGIDEFGNPVPADPYMDSIRRALTQDGQILIFANKGFAGPLTANASSMQDVKWGPKTQMIHWEPVGGNLAVEFVWKCSVCLPLCCCGNEIWSGIMAYNYEAEYDIDAQGMTTRSITGYIEIAQTRVGGSKQVAASADDFWEQITVQPLSGYERTKRRKLSKDKSRLEFTIVDKQIPSPNAYPPNCTSVRAKHSRVWSRQTGPSYRNQISVDITRQAGTSGTLSWLIFGNIVAARLLAEKNGGSGVIIDELGVEEDLFGLSSNFRIGYRVLSGIYDFLGTSGLWTPIGTDWGSWACSLQGTMFAPRGQSALRHPGAFDAIVDLCGSAIVPIGGQNQGTPNASPSQTPTFKNQLPPPQSSYGQYSAEIAIDGKSPMARQKTLQPGDTAPVQWNPTAVQPFQIDAPPSGAVNDVIIQRGIRHVTARFKGHAIRVGYPVPRPSIQSIGGVPVKEKRGKFSQKVIGNYFGVAVYGAVWDITYILQNPPPTVNAPANPEAGVDDNGNAVAPNN